MTHQGRVAVVTGSSRGIGRGIAIKLAASGAKVVVNYKGNEQLAQEVADAIIAQGSEAVILRGDVSKSADARNLVDQTIASFGRLDILVNNAGITRDNIALRMSEEDWDDVLGTNLKAAFLCSKFALKPMMRQRWGRIVNISSIAGIMGNIGQANYVSAKAGIIGLTKAIAQEMGTRGITVNAIAPGFIRSDMSDVIAESVKEKMSQQIAVGRIGTPEDIAEAVSFLASDGASYITGQVIAVDGGLNMG